MLHQDLFPGPGSSDPSVPVLAGSTLLFTADDGATGIELWAMRSMAAAVPFGAGCAGTGGKVPRIYASDTPALGNAGFAAGLVDALPLTSAMLFCGTGPGVVSLSSGCTLWLQRVVFGIPVFVYASGTAWVSLSIPADPALLGIQAFAQYGVLDPSGSFFGLLSFSDALKIVVSDR